MLIINKYIKSLLSIMILCGTATQLNAAWSDYFAYLNPARAYTALRQYFASKELTLTRDFTRELKTLLTTIENNGKGTQGQWYQIKQLITSGADINTVTTELHNSALHLAASDPDQAIIKSLGIIKFLLDKGTNQSLENSDGITFQDIEESKRRILTPSSFTKTQTLPSNCSAILSETTESLNQKLQQQLNMLTTADRKDWKTILQLINLGADINIQNQNGDTLLHIAVAEGDSGRVFTLLGYKNLNANLQNNNYLRPLDIAEQLKNEQIIRILNHYGAIRSGMPYRSQRGLVILHPKK